MTNFDIITSSDMTLSPVESEKVTALANNYGKTFADGASDIIKANRIESASALFKAIATYTAIRSYEEHCTDRAKCKKARSAFMECTGMDASTVTRMISIYTNVYHVLIQHKAVFDSNKTFSPISKDAFWLTATAIAPPT